MQNDQDNPAISTTRPRLARTRFVEIQPAQQTTGKLSTTGDLDTEQATNNTGKLGSNTQKRAASANKHATHEDGPISLQARSTAYLTQLSGMLRPLHARQDAQPEIEEDGYWPLGIQQVGPLPIINMYGREPFGRTLPSAVPLVTPMDGAPTPPTWQRVLTSPACKISLGLLVGLGLLFLASLFVDLPATFALLSTHLLTPQGIGLGLLAGLAYLVGHALRGLRWKLFLNPIGQVSTLKVIGLYQVGALLNFLLPVRAGEAAKCLALKRIAKIPISKSLPTVAIDKVLDLLPALIILALVPFLGVQMDLQIWLVLGLVGLILLILLLFIGLIAWKRSFALKLLQNMLILFPRVIGNKIEGFVAGFVDALLAGVSNPMICLPALLLAGLAALSDGLFIMLAFWAIGTPISFGIALFGYTLCTLFSILPTPPGQLGSNEAVGLLIFSGLLGLPASAVAAMLILSHPWTALLLLIAGLASLIALGLTIKSAMHVQGE